MAFKFDATKFDSQHWDEMANQLSSGDGGLFYSLKDGKTRVRLVALDENGSFFTETKRAWGDKVRSKVLVAANIMQLPKGEVSEDLKKKVVFLVLPKQAIKSIISLLAEGYDLLSDDTGRGLTIVRSGSGLDTSYSILPGPKAIPLPTDIVRPDKTLAEYSEQYEKESQERNKNRSTNDSKGSKGSKDSEESGDDW